MSTIWEEIRFKVIHSGSKVNLLIGINVGVYLVLGLIYVFETLITSQSVLHDQIFNYLALPSYLPNLLPKFWTVLTYMFMHDVTLTLGAILHFVFNMMWFFWIGQLFEEYLGSKKLLSIYIFGGLFGAAFFILGYNLFPAFAQLKLHDVAIGAPACVMAVIVGTATLLPDYTIFMMFVGPVRLKWIAVIYVILDVLFLIGPNSGNILAHLGGALLGYIYVRQLKSGHDWGNAVAKIFRPKSKLKVVYKSTSKALADKPQQYEIDMILDKISVSGIESLSKHEQEILDRASSNDRS